MLRENNESLENWCNIKHKSCVIPEGFDITFISGIEKDWSIFFIEMLILKRNNNSKLIKNYTNHIFFENSTVY